MEAGAGVADADLASVRVAQRRIARAASTLQAHPVREALDGAALGELKKDLHGRRAGALLRTRPS